jgi:GT2 family glycosyltransferase
MASVIIVNWNGLHHLKDCLDALRGQSLQSFEVILVDNGSTDGSAEFVDVQYPEVKVIHLPSNRGFCGGNNAGLSSARGRYIALLNNDTAPDPAWLSEAVGALESNPQAGFIASQMRLFDRPNLIDTAGDLYFRTGYPGKRGWLMPTSSVAASAWVFGACAGAAVYRRSLIDDVGLFDEDFFCCMEDVDLSFRAQLAGYRCLYVSSAIVYHKVGGTLATRSTAYQRWSHRNHWYTLIKNLPGMLWIRYLPSIVLSEFIVLASAVLHHRLGVFVSARIEVLRMLPRLMAKRRETQRQRRVSVAYLDSVIERGWLSYTLGSNRREQSLATKDVS